MAKAMYPAMQDAWRENLARNRETAMRDAVAETKVTGRAPEKSSSANERQVGGRHYQTDNGVQHWDLFGPDYLIGYATKYMRWRKKGGVEDLEKAIHVIEKLKEIVTEANLPKYDRKKMVQWCDGVGLDWVERRVVDLIMFMRGHSDLDEAIGAIQYLIEQNRPSNLTPRVETQKAERMPPGFDLGAGPIRVGDKAWYRADAKAVEVVVKVLEVMQGGDAMISILGGAPAMVKWRTLRPYTPEVVTNTPRAGESEAQTQARERRVPRFEGPKMKGPVAEAVRDHASMLSPHPKFGGYAKHPDGQPSTDAERQRSPADGAQHESLFPWRMTRDQFSSLFVGRIERALEFVRPLGTSHFILEPAVYYGDNPAMFSELTQCYSTWLDGGYHLLLIERLPPDLRDHYPRLRMELNAVEWESQEKWKKPLYEWSTEGEGKWRLKDSELLWGPEL